MLGTNEISNCINYGTVELKEGTGLYAGGICGGMGTTDDTRIYNCINNGSIVGNTTSGGIVGLLSTNGTVEECRNFGKVTSTQNVAGGIAGQFNQNNGQSKSKALKCYNSGEISGKNEIGGIVGWFCGETEQGTIEKCYNKGMITSEEEDCGAIVGIQAVYDGNATFDNLYYLNSVGLFAINNQEKYNTETIKAVEIDLKTYEEFIEWINKI